jgi:hypothetical protein
MSNLVEQTCQVRVNAAADSIFYWWDDSDNEAYQDSNDPETRAMYENYLGSVVCGQPAADYVDFFGTRVWMCPVHYAMHQEFS